MFESTATRGRNPRQLQKQPRFSILLALLACALSAPLGCNSKSAPTEANFTLGLNKYLTDRSECLFPNTRFPYETSDSGEMKRMNTLVAAQLLKVSSEREIHVSRFVPTDLGAKVAPHFCYGYREVTSIVSSTPPAPANGFTETRIVYAYKMHDVPVWAKDDAVKAVFPTLAHNLSGTATDTVTMAQTAVGWQVPD